MNHTSFPLQIEIINSKFLFINNWLITILFIFFHILYKILDSFIFINYRNKSEHQKVLFCSAVCIFNFSEGFEHKTIL